MMDKATKEYILNGVKRGVRMATMIIILVFMVWAYIDHDRYPEKYQIIENETRDGWTDISGTLIDQDNCECQEAVVLNTLVTWMDRVKLPFLILAIVWLVVILIERKD